MPECGRSHSSQYTTKTPKPVVRATGLDFINVTIQESTPMHDQFSTPGGACDHTHVDIRAFTCANSTIQYVKQCLTCGAKVGGPIKKADVVAARGDLQFIAPFDLEAQERTREAARIAWREESERTLAEKEQEREAAWSERKAEWAAWYSEYLQSEKWANTRRKVMERARCLCEGCSENKASVVHHLTYDNVGDELLYQLVALCRPCHDKAHGRDKA